MNEVTLAASIVAGIVVSCGALFWLATIYQDGILDVRYPSIADGDHRNGVLRQVYLAGRRRGERQKVTEAERRLITQERQRAAR